MQIVKWWRGSAEDWAFRWLCMSAFGAAFSLPLGRAFLLLGLITLGVRMARGEGRVAFPPAAWFWAAYAAVAVLASVFGVNPALSAGKLSKLIWFMGIPAAATLVTSSTRARAVLRAYVYGAGVLSLDILLRRTGTAWRAGRAAVAAGGELNLWWRIIDDGSMTHGQVLMAALIALAGLLTIAARERMDSRKETPDRPPIAISIPFGWTMLAGITAALLINFKRGSWVAAGIVTALFLALTGRRWRVAALVAAVAVLVLLPPVQQRLTALRSELTLDHGGRLVMWTRIAPLLIREHPFGIGYRALDERLMQDTAARLDVRVEKNRNHLHSNLLQILVSTGWAGLAIYLGWMGCGLHAGSRQTIRAGTQDTPERVLSLALTLMLAGLILNGLVEYNFGDAEIVLLYGLVFGLLSRGGRPQ